ncbi:MAG TPA: hypothetical protein QGF05_00865, partial [Dehalococcoidia bacterium]|nr:hypothetical protein [Dehalococcoidia bacterium]
MWDESGLVLFDVDPSMYDLDRGELAPESTCKHVRAGGGNAIRLTVHCAQGYTYFQSEIAPLAPTYERGRDYVAEFAASAHRHRLQIAYAINVASNPTVAEARPEWRQIGPDGQPHSWGGAAALCVNTDYLLYLTELVREFTAKYGPDCLCFDNFALLNGCACPGCRGTLLGDTGIDIAEIVPGSPEQARYAKWRLERTERLAWQLGMAAKQYRGDCQVVFSGCHWSDERAHAIGWRPEATADWMDGVQSEVAARWYGHSLSETDMIGAHHRAMGHQGWCWVEHARLPFGRLACPPHELLTNAASVLAAGCRPCVWPITTTALEDQSALPALGELLAQFDGERDRLTIEGSFARVGVLSSHVGGGCTDTLRAWC